MSKVLVVVDMQNDFVDENVLGNEHCKAIIPTIIEELETGNYDKIFFTKDTHHNNYLETQEGKNLPTKHCILGTKGWALIKEIFMATTKTNIPVHIITKETFGSKILGEELLKINDLSEVVFVGVCTGICVISNALLVKAFCPEVKITVKSNACACITKESHERALKAMELCQINIE